MGGIPDDSRPREGELERRLRLLPRQPGVYYLRDRGGRLLYVGKAKNLAARVRSYFRKPIEDPRLQRLRSEIHTFDYIVTSSEAEAFILENNCIKEHQPPYNIQLKDDKRYPYIKITTAHPFPGIFVTRNLRRDGSDNFGPYTHVKALRQTLKTLRSIFPLRNCTDARLARGGRECLEYHMGKCPAPCTQRISREDYGQIVKRLLLVLEGKGSGVLRELRERMEAATRTWAFEEAARLRDLIRGIEELGQRQHMLRMEPWDADVIGLAHRGERATAIVISEREGRVVGRKQLHLRGAAGRGREEVLEAFLAQFYSAKLRIPPRIVIPFALPAREAMEVTLGQWAGHRVRICQARGSRWGRLAATTAQNAALSLEEDELVEARRSQRSDPAVYALQEALELASPPYRIEGYDISTIQGCHSVGSRVVFVDGVPLKACYRRYRIRGVAGQDDVAMLGEVLLRRVERALSGEDPLPDLVMVDGGRGQVARARKVLRASGFQQLPVIGLAKREEEIIGPRGTEVRRLGRSSAALKLLQRIRDEAHRFAVGYHRRLRGSALRASSLDDIPGIGPSRKTALLAAFGSLEGVLRAAPEELARVPGVGARLAQRIRTALEAQRGSGTI